MLSYSATLHFSAFHHTTGYTTFIHIHTCENVQCWGKYSNILNTQQGHQILSTAWVKLKQGSWQEAILHLILLCGILNQNYYQEGKVNSKKSVVCLRQVLMYFSYLHHLVITKMIMSIFMKSKHIIISALDSVVLQSNFNIFNIKLNWKVLSRIFL